MPKLIPFQAPAVNRRLVGDAVVTMLSDGHLDISFDLLAGIEEREAEDILAAQNVSRLPRIHINAYFVEIGGRTILIDSGAGGLNGWGGRLPVALAAAGIDPMKIDTILMTHGHPDHIGGIAGPLATPLFQNVQKLFVHRDELVFWRDDAIRSAVPKDFVPFFDLARNAFDAYDDRLVPFVGEDLLPGVSAVPLPGHTAGHTGYLIEDKGESLLIWGDIVHFPHIQIARPEVTIALDSDPAAAAIARARILDRVSADGLAVTGLHFNLPAAGHVERGANGYQLVYEPWSSSLI